MKRKSKSKTKSLSLLRTIVISLVAFVAVVAMTSGIVAAQSATRTLPDEPVLPSANFDVEIEAVLAYDTIFGQVIETLPEGFTYVSSPLEEEGAVEIDGNTIKFTFLVGEDSFTYTVTASSVEETYPFSGILKDWDKIEYPVGGDTNVTVGLPVANVVINEFMSDNATEWVELFNNGSSDIDLTGWTLSDKVGTSKSLSGLGTIAVGGYMVFTCPSGWLNNDGDVIWLNSTIENVDRVGYGTSGEAPAPDAGNSTGRYPNGKDTDNDAEDFIEFGIPTPGAENTIGLPKTGNMDGIGEVDLQDVVLLARHVLISQDEYPIYADGNVDSIGGVDLQDVVLLARHVLISQDEYPLYPEDQ